MSGIFFGLSFLICFVQSLKEMLCDRAAVLSFFSFAEEDATPDVFEDMLCHQVAQPDSWSPFLVWEFSRVNLLMYCACLSCICNSDLSFGLIGAFLCLVRGVFGLVSVDYFCCIFLCC